MRAERGGQKFKGCGELSVSFDTGERGYVKKEAESIKRLEGTLKSDNLSMEKLYENAGQAEGALKADVELAEAFREEILREKASSCYGEKGLVLGENRSIISFLSWCIGRVEGGPSDCEADIARPAR